MKICHLVHSYYPATGGIQIQTKSLAEGLTYLGHSNVVFTKRFDNYLKKEEIIKGVKIIRKIYPSRGKNLFLKLFGAVLNSILLVRMKERFQLIHSKSPYLEFLIPCWILKKMFGKKVVYSLSIADEMSSLQFNKITSLQLLIKKLLISSLDSIVTMSTDLAADANKFGVSPKKIAYIMNGIESDRFVPKPSKKIERRVIFVGRINQQNGVDVLLCAWNLF